MGTTIRPEVSEKNPYWIERHRYYELKHFCLQYQSWKRAYFALDGMSKRPADLAAIAKRYPGGDPVSKCVEARIFYKDRIDMVEKAARETDPIIGRYILRAVTEGVSYEVAKTRDHIPCSKDVYYELYRKFFWLLHQARQ